MPYIKPALRQPLRAGTFKPETPGDLTYLITTIVDEYLGRYPISYDGINAAIGVLECTKLELYRRIAAPYESVKLATNGDVYTCLSKNSMLPDPCPDIQSSTSRPSERPLSISEAEGTASSVLLNLTNKAETPKQR